MATNYVKVSPFVAQKLGVASQRCTYPDGSYQLWEKDLMMVDRGWVRRVEETLARIGGVMFDPYSNLEERNRKPEDCTPLPEPADPEWIAPPELEEEAESSEGLEISEVLESPEKLEESEELTPDWEGGEA